MCSLSWRAFVPSTITFKRRSQVRFLTKFINVWCRHPKTLMRLLVPLLFFIHENSWCWSGIEQRKILRMFIWKVLLLRPFLSSSRPWRWWKPVWMSTTPATSRCKPRLGLISPHPIPFSFLYMYIYLPQHSRLYVATRRNSSGSYRCLYKKGKGSICMSRTSITIQKWNRSISSLPVGNTKKKKRKSTASHFHFFFFSKGTKCKLLFVVLLIG